MNNPLIIGMFFSPFGRRAALSSYVPPVNGMRTLCIPSAHSVHGSFRFAAIEILTTRFCLFRSDIVRQRLPLREARSS
jgi:hypothetical protein